MASTTTSSPADSSRNDLVRISSMTATVAPARVSSRRFMDAMSARGFGPYIGVPCSFLRPFIDYVIDRPDVEYIAATNEGEALAIAAGARVAGRRPVVMLQNSGLGNMVNPLSSLTYIFEIPVLIIVTLRGELGLRDEPQHELMGRVTREMLTLLAVENDWFPAADDDIEDRIDAAMRRMEETRRPFAFVLRKNMVDEYAGRGQSARPRRPRGNVLEAADDGTLPSRRDAIDRISDVAPPHTAIIATTGKTGRELFEHRDAPNHFYMVGSMGCASSFGLGVAMHARKPVIVLDGDGAALMRLEAMASIGHAAPPRFVHVVLDNESYESTGAQATISGSVDFPAIAAACGYASSCSATGLGALETAVRRALSTEGPHLIHSRVAIGTDPGLGRPGVSPPEVARRFSAFLSSPDAAVGPA